LFKGFNFDFDVFYEVRNNILIRNAGTIPTGIFGTGAVAGNGTISLPPINSGKVKNQGFELSLGYQKTIGQDCSIGLIANSAYSRNKILYMTEVLLPEDYACRYRSTGYRLGQPFGYETAGFFNSQDEIDSWFDQTPLGAAPKLGDLKYVDKNGDNKINEKDIVPIGDPNVPDWTFGGSLNLRYKWFDLSIMLQGTGGSSYYLKWNRNLGNREF